METLSTFENMADYILRPNAERRQHLDLTAACIEIGGTSAHCWALLAHHIKTTMPPRAVKPVIHLCHACGNGKCSNVLHLYWGTASENAFDARAHGTRLSFYENTKKKHGEKIHDIMKQNGSNKGKRDVALG